MRAARGDTNPGTGTAVRVEVFDEDAKLAGIGSGVILEDGTILTARHVVHDSKSVKVNVEGGTQYEAIVLWEDDERDVALVTTGSSLGRGSELACSYPPTVGQEVEIVGNPDGLDFLHTWGRVAGAERVFEGQSVFFLDASVGPGNSGGPVYDSKGRVVGLLVALLTAPLGGFSISSIGIGAAISAPTICGVIARHAVS